MDQKMKKLNNKQLTEIYQKTILNINFNKKRIKEQHDRLNNNKNDYLLKVYHLQLLKNYEKLTILSIDKFNDLDKMKGMI